MQTEGQHEVPVLRAGQGHGEVIVDALLQLVQHGQAVRRRKVNLRLAHRIGDARTLQGMNGHDEPSTARKRGAEPVRSRQSAVRILSSLCARRETFPATETACLPLSH